MPSLSRPVDQRLRQQPEPGIVFPVLMASTSARSVARGRPGAEANQEFSVITDAGVVFPPRGPGLGTSAASACRSRITPPRADALYKATQPSSPSAGNRRWPHLFSYQIGAQDPCRREPREGPGQGVSLTDLFETMQVIWARSMSTTSTVPDLPVNVQPTSASACTRHV